ncbi:Flp pilus assembly complex ATPase component TadA [Candidatus Gracilibacteria bacterium]|nr:Flp pilus assembly complex ATPase component TadA [Candidatus Gracilibacteria bacterium]
MKFEDKKIKEILLSESYVSEEDVKKAEVFAKSHKSSLVDYFLMEGIITKALLGQAVAEFFKMNYADMILHPILAESVLRIPELIAKEYRVALFSEKEKEVVIATDRPDKKLIPKLKKILKKNVILAYSLPEEIDSIFIHYQKSLEKRFSMIIEKQEKVAPEILEEIFEDAVTNGASDIHFEPQGKEAFIRFRIDGVLHEVGILAKEYYENILNRIKVQSHLRIDEHFSAQDGAIRYFLKDKHMTVDMRVAIVPVLDGEKIVIRLLAQYVQDFTLSGIGLSEVDETLFRTISKKPFGMVLVTGPTGAGKTTTLYALLKTLHHPEINITTIEDPVEYKISGMNQIQVNQQTNLTFSEGLKSIVRQDPDIILVGEIRDRETAEIGVNAALTGHLLFSTFHANDSATAIPRLLDMGIEPFLLASTLEVIVAQRLIRTICLSCRQSQKVKQSQIIKEFPKLKSFYKDSDEYVTIYKGKGCPACRNTGYRGRKALFEFLEITPEMRDLILENPSTKQIWNLAKLQGARSLFEDGMDKVHNGITTIEEVLRVASL